MSNSAGMSWRRQDSNLRLRGYEPRGLSELPYSALAPGSSESQLALAAEVNCVFPSDRNAGSDVDARVGFRQAHHRAVGMFRWKRNRQGSSLFGREDTLGVVSEVGDAPTSVVVDRTGFEPVTSCVPRKRATNCANSPILPPDAAR